MANDASGVDGSRFALIEVDLNKGVRPKRLAEVIDELRLDHDSVRFSTQRKDGERVCFGIFGPRIFAHAAYEALACQVPVTLADSLDALFALHVSLRDLSVEGGSYDVELEDALHAQDYIKVDSIEEGDEELDDSGLLADSVESIIARRVGGLMSPNPRLHLFMDEDPFAGCQERHFTEGAFTMCLVGCLSAWDAAVEVISSCKNVHLPLSERYDALFWCTGGVRSALEEQMQQAVTHWKGNVVSLGSGLGLGHAAWSGFPDLAANVSAVLRGDQGPGWRRLVMVPVHEGGHCFPELRF